MNGLAFRDSPATRSFFPYMITFPPEVIQHLVRWLPQHDLLHLAYTSKQFYALLQPQLFQAIIVDSSRTSFDDVFADPANDWFVYHEYPCEPTVIRTLYSLIRFFKLLIKNPQFGKYVRRFVVEEQFPDMSQLELNQYLLQVLPSLTNIEIILWASTHNLLDARMISLLPNHNRLKSLCGNFSFADVNFPQVAFSNLHQLSISNFSTNKSLRTIDVSNFPSITSLAISRKLSLRENDFTCRLENCCQSALNSSVELLQPFDPATFISSLFDKKLNSKLNLKSLSLKDISLSASDATRLKENIEISLLEHLSINNCTECLFESSPSYPTTSAFRRRTPPRNLFIDVLAPDLISVKLLNLNLSNELCYNRSTFSALSQMKGLEKVSVHIKLIRTEHQVNLAPLVNCLQTHASTLKYLNLCCDIVDPSSVSVCPKKKLSYSLESVIGLSMLKELRVLKLPIEYSQISNLPDILTNLKNLRVLQMGIVYSDSAPSKSACFDCGVNSFVLGTANSLINESYFACSTSLTARIETSKGQQYEEISRRFKNASEKLRFIRFDLQKESLLYDVSDKERITAQNSSIECFDMIIKLVTESTLF